MKKILKKIRDEVKNIRNVFYSKVLYKRYLGSKSKKAIVDNFFNYYYNLGEFFGKTWQETYWMGYKIKKLPTDLLIYQEIIFNKKPDIIIESGTGYGGSALFLAHMCDLVKKGKILTIDIKANKSKPKHKRIEYFIGSSTSKEIIDKLKKKIKKKDKIMVILDSDHKKDHVLRELEIYNEFVTKDNYLIVEDTCINGNPVRLDFGPGPMEAVKEFLNKNKRFRVDSTLEKFLISFNPKGYLKKIK